MQHAAVFEHLPIESIIKKKQSEYYGALNESDRKGSSTSFAIFMLQIIDQSLGELLKDQRVSLSSLDCITRFQEKVGRGSFSRKDYLRNFKHISPATASRDLKEGVNHGLLERSGDKRNYLQIQRVSLASYGPETMNATNKKLHKTASRQKV